MRTLAFLLNTFFFLFNTLLQAQKPMNIDIIKGINVGDYVENFIAIDHLGNSFTLDDVLESKHVVLVFYRGQWCGYCNKHLSNLQDSLGLIDGLGAKVIAVSPEKPEVSAKLAIKLGTTFKLLYDQEYIIAKQFDVLFNPSKTVKLKYNAIGADMTNAHNNEKQFLPVPGTFVISKESVVVWKHFNPDYKVRSKVGDLIKVLEQLP